jgi:nitrate/TMAO reductase-like tetraheme cytochrome c subunit
MIRILLPVLILFLLWGPVLAADSVCLQCHAGQEGHLAAPVARWQASIHAANGVSCHDCHGGDPSDFGMAMDPSKGFVGVPGYAEVPVFCGRCHPGVAEDYTESAHGKALERGGPQCVSCHGNHAVHRASIDLINEKSCSRCHDYDKAARVKQAIAQTEANLQRLEVQLAELHRVGIDTEKIGGQLFAVRNDFRRLFHTVNVEKMEAETAGFATRLARIDAQIGELKDELSQRKLVGGLVVLLLIAAGCIALLIRKTYHAEE